MKLVREQFIRGVNPLKTLNIGKRVVIENWFNDLYVGGKLYI